MSGLKLLNCYFPSLGIAPWCSYKQRTYPFSQLSFCQAPSVVTESGDKTALLLEINCYLFHTMQLATCFHCHLAAEVEHLVLAQGNQLQPCFVLFLNLSVMTFPSFSQMFVEKYLSQCNWKGFLQVHLVVVNITYGWFS